MQVNECPQRYQCHLECHYSPVLPSLQQACPSTRPQEPSETLSRECLHFHRSCKRRVVLKDGVLIPWPHIRHSGGLLNNTDLFSTFSGSHVNSLGWGLGIDISSFSVILGVARVENHSFNQRNETPAVQQDEATGIFGGLPRNVRLLTWASTPIHLSPASCPCGPEVTAGFITSFSSCFPICQFNVKCGSFRTLVTSLSKHLLYQAWGRRVPKLSPQRGNHR